MREAQEREGTDVPLDESPDESRAEPAGPAEPVAPPAGLGRDLALYTVARFGLVAVVAVVLAVVGVPWLIGVAVGLVVGMPLAMLLMRGLHNRVSAGLAARAEFRRAQRARLRAELRGAAADEPDSDDPRDSR